MQFATANQRFGVLHNKTWKFMVIFMPVKNAEMFKNRLKSEPWRYIIVLVKIIVNDINF